MVTGGYGDLDTTEIFSDNVWRTVAAKLQWYGQSIATINNRVLSFGKSLLLMKFDF